MTRDTAQEVLNVLDDELTSEHIIKMSPEDKMRLKDLLKYWLGQLEILSQERKVTNENRKQPDQRGRAFSD
jgi:hypothetical protein